MGSNHAGCLLLARAHRRLEAQVHGCTSPITFWEKKMCYKAMWWGDPCSRIFFTAPDPTSHPLSESLGDAGPLPSSSCLDVSTPEGNADPAQGPCPHRNGGLRTPKRDGAKRRPCCQGDAKGDVVLLATTWPHHKEHGHGFPLPATELGAAALVTTKTTQECMGEERL